MSERIRSMKWVVDRAAFLCFHMFFRNRRGNASKTVAIIRTDGIGDLVFFLPLVADLRNHFVGHRFVLVCRDEAAPIAVSGVFDKVISYRYLRYRWNYFYRIWILAKIRSTRPSLSLYLSYHRQHIGDEMAILSGAERVAAFDGNDEIIHPSMRKANDSYYSDVVDVPDHSPESAKYRAFFGKLGIKAEGRSEARKALFSQKREPQNADPDSYVVLAPGGSSPLRRWPWERFTELGDRLVERTGMRIILCGNRDDREMLERIAGKMTTAPTIETGLPIQSVAELIKRAKLVVGNESGLLHIAASVGTHSVVILGGGHFSRYFPYGSARIVNHKLDCYECNWKCPFPEVYCLTRITVEEVMREVGRIVGRDAVPT
ncbi:MAG TPA: glycosyltransferase family 9 protein [Bacteroidota bacterium]|nr:glycosyltransferase family 9 protein [Bacteroidota bacterium]